ncbi:glycosyltransferase family 10 domain-containing protein [Rhodosalinus halophilus]|uniref:glycosyltransferase family 10 domain-containing protein n=1 Tax=Rhodosalinus halophilus TaxID=2259333 RepID=UPI001F3D9219|nr:glycosyltransferase family 10 [Rhodosalinus halophilus]
MTAASQSIPVTQDGNRTAPLRVFPYGDYQHRQPLAYVPIRRACAGRIEITERMEQAQVVVIAHVKDLKAHGEKLRRSLHPDQTLVLLSEEPFWDTAWGGVPGSATLTRETPDGPITARQLNHQTSRVFEFKAIPYFPLTDRSFFNRYALRFTRNARLDAEAWRTVFARRRDIVFMATRRESEKYDVAWPMHEIYGLSALRTRIAMACEDERVRRIGLRWNEEPPRQDLPDWHLDKLLQLEDNCRVLSAIENTHQRNYLTEKLFDAFAIGAIPLYVAAPSHRVHEVVPDGGWINLFGLEPETAAQRILDFEPDAAFCEAYAKTQRRLARLFGSVGTLRREYERLASDLEASLRAAANHPQGTSTAA